MAKLGLVSLIATFVATFALVIGFSSHEADGAKACSRKKFETKLVGDACKAGGQGEAKKKMQGFLKDAKKKQADLGCASCHSKVGGDYPLKPDGLKKFKALGGL